ncbi:MAG TPA: hypothetical protein VGL19_08780 [Polyangiaceae bacterium]
MLVCVALGALSVAAPARAQSDAARAAARDLGGEGVSDYQAGNFAAASKKLERAFDILRVPSLGLWSARALAKSGKLVEASERYLAVSRLDASKGDTAVQKQAQVDAATEHDTLQARIPGLTLKVKGAGPDVSVTLDGASVPSALLGVKQPANPGAHVAEARDAGRVVRLELTLAEGQRLKTTLDFANSTALPAAATEPAATPAPSPVAAAAAQPSAPLPASAPQAAPSPAADSGSRGVPAGVWVGIAVAGAGVATGTITAVLASKKKGDLGCPSSGCLPSQSSDVDSYNQLLTISTVGFIAAGVGVATAGVFWFTRPRDAERTGYVSPWLGLGAAGVRGTF